MRAEGWGIREDLPEPNNQQREALLALTRMSIVLTANRRASVACTLAGLCRLYASRFSPHAHSLSASSDATDDARNKHALSSKSHVANGRRKLFFPTITPPPPRPQISKLGGGVPGK